MYGFGNLDIDMARELVSNLLNVELKKREGLHFGVYYLSETPTGSLTLRENVDPFDFEPIERDYPDHRVLLFAYDMTRPDDIWALLLEGGVVHLNRSL
jgi:hypothetical protein